MQHEPELSDLILDQPYIGLRCEWIQYRLREFDPVANTWTQKQTSREAVVNAAGFSIGALGYAGTGDEWIHK